MLLTNYFQLPQFWNTYKIIHYNGLIREVNYAPFLSLDSFASLYSSLWFLPPDQSVWHCGLESTKMSIIFSSLSCIYYVHEWMKECSLVRQGRKVNDDDVRVILRMCITASYIVVVVPRTFIVFSCLMRYHITANICINDPSLFPSLSLPIYLHTKISLTDAIGCFWEY